MLCDCLHTSSLPAVMTVTNLAQQAASCLTQPGCGYMLDTAGPAGMVCAIGTYSSGSNQQPCVPCPAGLTTVAARQESIAACMAPAGYFMQVCCHACHHKLCVCNLEKCPAPSVSTGPCRYPAASGCMQSTVLVQACLQLPAGCVSTVCLQWLRSLTFRRTTSSG